MERNNLSLYIHVPFCQSKCYYCDFNSFPGKQETIPGYFDALFKEIELYGEKLKDSTIKTIFIGGGTPSIVEPIFIYKLMNKCRQYLNIEKGSEISIESNPGTLSFEKLSAYKAMGINRLSMGLQAWQNRLLKKIGRIHSSEEFAENYENALKAGFRNINIDLIFGIPTQSIKEWEDTIDNIMALKPSHLSCYSLKIEDETKFGQMADRGELFPVEDELDREMYQMVLDKLKESGYRHYEISNFSKEGFECKHNITYWNAEEYIGLGAGAHSYLNKSRYNNVYNIEEYISLINRNEPTVENELEISREDEMSEFVILGLRLIDGISMKEFKSRFEVDFTEVYGQKAEKLAEKGLVSLGNDRFKLTRYGLDVANEVFTEFI